MLYISGSAKNLQLKQCQERNALVESVTSVQLDYTATAHDVVFEQPHKVTTNTRILRWYRCRRRKGGDGIYDEKRSIWTVPACKHKCCGRHWRRYALDKEQEIAASRPDRLHWYHLVLHCCVRLKHRKRFPNLGRFIKKLRQGHSELWGCAVYHEGSHADHIDLLLGVNAELDFDSTRLCWKAHFPAKDTRRWHGQYCTIKPHDDPGYCIAYQLHLKDGKPRTRPPWGKIPFRSPYRVYKPSSLKSQEMYPGPPVHT